MMPLYSSFRDVCHIDGMKKCTKNTTEQRKSKNIGDMVMIGFVVSTFMFLNMTKGYLIYEK